MAVDCSAAGTATRPPIGGSPCQATQTMNQLKKRAILGNLPTYQHFSGISNRIAVAEEFFNSFVVFQAYERQENSVFGHELPFDPNSFKRVIRR